jgi:hypothetical protein
MRLLWWILEEVTPNGLNDRKGSRTAVVLSGEHASIWTKEPLADQTFQRELLSRYRSEE